MTKIPQKTQKWLKYLWNPKKDQNTPEAQKNDQNTSETQKMTKIPQKPKNDQIPLKP